MIGRPKPPPPPGSERRQHPRYEVLAQVEVTDDDATLILPVRNISAGGISVGLDTEEIPGVRVGDLVTIFLDATEAASGGHDTASGGSHASLSPGGDSDLQATLSARVVRVDRARTAADSDGGDEARAPATGLALRWEFADQESAERFGQLFSVLRGHSTPLGE